MNNKNIIEQINQDNELPFALNSNLHSNELQSISNYLKFTNIFNIKPPFETLISNVNAKKCNKSLYITYNKSKIIKYKRTNIRRKTI